MVLFFSASGLLENISVRVCDFDFVRKDEARDKSILLGNNTHFANKVIKKLEAEFAESKVIVPSTK